MTDWSDRRTCVLFGDGAGAAVLTPGDNIKSVKLSASSATDRLWQYRLLHPTPYITKEEVDVPLQMKGQEVFKFAVKAAGKDISRTLKELGISADDVDHYPLPPQMTHPHPAPSQQTCAHPAPRCLQEWRICCSQRVAKLERIVYMK